MIDHVHGDTRPHAIERPIGHDVDGTYTPDFVSPDLISQHHDSITPVQRLTDPWSRTMRLEDRMMRLEYRMNRTLRRIPVNGLNTHQNHQAIAVDEISTRFPGASNTRAEKFLKSLPTLSFSDLSEGDQDCPICIETYNNDRHSESPVRLPCKHIMGKDCLLNWLKSSVLNAKNNTCPMCRTVLFERDISLENTLQGEIVDQNPETYREIMNELARHNSEILGQIRRDQTRGEQIRRDQIRRDDELAQTRDWNHQEYQQLAALRVGLTTDRLISARARQEGAVNQIQRDDERIEILEQNYRTLAARWARPNGDRALEQSGGAASTRARPGRVVDQQARIHEEWNGILERHNQRLTGLLARSNRPRTLEQPERGSARTRPDGFVNQSRRVEGQYWMFPPLRERANGVLPPSRGMGAPARPGGVENRIPRNEEQDSTIAELRAVPARARPA